MNKLAVKLWLLLLVASVAAEQEAIVDDAVALVVDESVDEKKVENGEHAVIFMDGPFFDQANSVGCTRCDCQNDQGSPGGPGPAGAPGDVGSAGPQGPNGEKGSCGPDGFPGVCGPPGKDGATGLPGWPGDAGPQGPEGPKGPTGPPGADGPQGPPGQCGPDGPQGLKGRDGKNGCPGAPGKDGKQGEKGRAGACGVPGVQGPCGDDGCVGPAGKPGLPGAPGTPGKQGQSTPGAPGPQGPCGDDGPIGASGKPGRKGAPGTDGQCGPDGAPGPVGAPGRDAPHVDLSSCSAYVYAIHSQRQEVPQCPPNHVQISCGYSLLHLQDEGRASGENLGNMGSCLPRFDPQPTMFCGGNEVCSWGSRTVSSYWLTTNQYELDHANDVIPPVQKPMSFINDRTKMMQHISRCAVCMSPGTVMALHSQSSSSPQCPKGNKYGKWVSLWEGYSFLMHAIGAAGVGQQLDSPGSCLRYHSHTPYVECDSNRYCHYWSDYMMYWLYASEVPLFNNTVKRGDVASRVGKCRVCAYQPANAFVCGAGSADF